MADPLEKQLEAVKDKFGATGEKLADGSTLVTIKDFPLPVGWNDSTTMVQFVVPVGYPFATPTSFWTDASLRTKSGEVPANTSVQGADPKGAERLWFSWHPTFWSAQKDTLENFVRVIESRLRQIT